MKIFIALLVLALLIYITVIYWVFKYTFAKKRGPMAVILKNTKLGGNFLEGYEGIIAQGVEWAKSQPFTDEYTISNDGLKLHGYFLENKGSERTVICVHGYRSSGFADFSVALRDLYNLGNNLLVIDQRSRGKSEGKYITFGVKEGDDCICWANHMLKTRGASHKVFFDGVSMGASSVITACGKGVPENVHGIIADSGFSCPWDIISKVMGDTLKKESKLIMNSLNMMTKLILKIDLKENTAAEAAKTCNVPCIIAHGTHDSFVPYEMSVKLYEAYNHPDKILITGKGANHGMAYMVEKELYTQKFIELFNK